MAIKILEMNFEEGKSYAKIGQELFGLGKDKPYSIVAAWKQELGLPKDQRWNKYWYYKLIKPEKLQDMITLYRDGTSTEKIGKKYAITGNTVASILRQAGEIIHPRGVQSKTNQTIFQEIDDEIKAYSLGLITADGSVDNNYMISITLTKSDSYLLEEINERLLGGSGTLLDTHTEDGDRSRVRLSFCGKALCEQLKLHGIVPRKTYTLKELSGLVPKELYHHYIRGLYDGDGACVRSNGRIRIGYSAGQKEFVQSYKHFLMSELDLNNNKIHNTGGCWQIFWGAKKDLIAFYNYIYKDATIFLGRKKIKLLNFLENTEVR